MQSACIATALTQRALLAVVALVGCGRRHFDLLDDARPGDGGAIDMVVLQSGCSDGVRDGFADLVAFPEVAGCAATWEGEPSLREPTTGGACGDDLAGGTPCAVPADACVAGWRVCGDKGAPGELTTRMTARQCADAGGLMEGAFVAALAHCVTCNNNCAGGEADCVYAATYDCPASAPTCKEPVCCGPSCAGENSCKSGVFPGGTVSAASGTPCGALPGAGQTGVLCCRDS